MEKESSIAFKLQDFSDFVRAFTDKMAEAVHKMPDYPLDLRLYDEQFGTCAYGFPVTLRDYLDIWESITETLKERDIAFIDFYANDEEANTAWYFDVTLWIVWDDANGVYSFE